MRIKKIGLLFLTAFSLFFAALSNTNAASTRLIVSTGGAYNVEFASSVSDFEDPSIFRVTLDDGTIVKPEKELYGEILAVQTAHYLASTTPTSILSQGIAISEGLQNVAIFRAADIDDNLPFLAAEGVGDIFIGLVGSAISTSFVGVGTTLSGAISSQIDIRATNGASAAYQGLFLNLGVAIENSIDTLSTNIDLLDDPEVRSEEVLNAWLAYVDAIVTAPAASRLLTDFESNLVDVISGIDEPLDSYLDSVDNISDFARDAFLDSQVTLISESLTDQLAPLANSAIQRRQNFIDLFGDVALDSGFFTSQFGELVEEAETKFIDQLTINGRILDTLDRFTALLTAVDVTTAGFGLLDSFQQLEALRGSILSTGQAMDQLVGESRFEAAFVTKESRKGFEDRAATLPVIGTINDDRILGSSEADRIFANDGNDEVNAGDGADYIVGGAGADTINGGNGDDLILPGLGVDIVDGEAGGDIYRGRIEDLSGDNLAFEFGDRVEIYGAVSQLPSFSTDSISVVGNRVSVDFSLDGAEDFFFFSDVGAIGRPVVLGERIENGQRTIIIQAGNDAAFVVDQSLNAGLASLEQATLGGMSSLGQTFSIGPTNINDGSDPELRNLAVTETGSIYTVFEYDAGENLSFGLDNVLPPLFPGDSGGVIVELDPETGTFIPSTIRAFVGGTGGSVPNTPPDFGINFVESINALAPIGGGEFLAIAEFRFSTSNPIRTLEGGPDFAFKIDTQGNTEFLVSWSAFGDGDGTRTVAADTSPITGEVFAWRDSVNSYGGGTLLRVDKNTGEPTVVGNFSTFEVTSIAFQTDGTLIGIGGNQSGQATIFEIDIISLTITPVQFLTGSFFPKEFDLFGDFKFKPESNGTSGDDTLGGTATDDRIDGGLGNDTLNGLDGDDDLFAGGGTDIIMPGLGDDVINVFDSTVNVRGTLAELDGDRIRGFNHDDTLTFSGTFGFSGAGLSSSPEALTLFLDVDGDGFADVTLIFEGVSAGQPFVFETDEFGNAVIRFGEQNIAPIANDDSLDLLSNEISFGNILANDTDENGDPLSINSIQGVVLDPLDTSAQIIDLPSGAQITFLADGAFFYDPRDTFSVLTEGETGTDTINYDSTDGIDFSGLATVTINITGAPSIPVQASVPINGILPFLAVIFGFIGARRFRQLI